jgi:hypothetical protein
MSAVLSGKPYTGRGAGGTSFDQFVARKAGESYRFRSLQIGVSQESFGEAIQRNMSWADRDRPLPPEMLPHRLFDRLFGVRDRASIDRQKSILDAVQDEARSLGPRVSRADHHKLGEYFEGIRDIEKRIARASKEERLEGWRPTLAQPEMPRPKHELPQDVPAHMKLMLDLVVLAFQMDKTRVASIICPTTILFGRGSRRSSGSSRTTRSRATTRSRLPTPSA